MARKKAKKFAGELDEDTLRKIYTEKKFIPPKEKELETINEDEKESSIDELRGTPTESSFIAEDYENSSPQLKVSIKVEHQLKLNW